MSGKRVLLYIEPTEGGGSSDVYQYVLLVSGGRPRIWAENSHVALTKYLSRKGEVEVVPLTPEGWLETLVRVAGEEPEEVHLDLTRGRRTLSLNVATTALSIFRERVTLWYGGWKRDTSGKEYFLVSLPFIPGQIIELWNGLSPDFLSVLDRVKEFLEVKLRSANPEQRRELSPLRKSLGKLVKLYSSLMLGLYTNEVLSEEEVRRLGKWIDDNLMPEFEEVRGVLPGTLTFLARESGFLDVGPKRCKKVLNFYVRNGHLSLFFLFGSQIVDNAVTCLLKGGPACGKNDASRDVVPLFWKEVRGKRLDQEDVARIAEGLSGKRPDDATVDILFFIAREFQTFRELRNHFAHGGAKEVEQVLKALSRQNLEDILKSITYLLDLIQARCLDR